MTEEKTHGKEIGKVIWFDHKKGYGFIHIISDTENSNKDVFCHYSSYMDGTIQPFAYLLPYTCPMISWACTCVHYQHPPEFII